jgi:HAE1 family hydrophobic/amphiphilic exporter-1
MLVRVMGMRPVVAILALAVIASSIPLYKSVRQEYLPGDTDEGEFEVGITAPEGTSITAMDTALRQVENEIRAIPAVDTVLASVGGGFIGGVN